MPSKVEAKKRPADEDDGELVLIEAAGGEIDGLELVESDHQEELHNKTQKLIDRTDGPLHGAIAEHLVRDANPSLDDQHWRKLFLGSRSCISLMRCLIFVCAFAKS
jgi:hypothetical protein